VAGERPHVTVMVGVDSLGGDRYVIERGALPGTCEMDHVGPVSPSTARRLACDASLMRVVMSGRSEPLDVGRRTPIVPPAMRRAVIVRDRACRFPGCDRPQAWCDAHHVTHWADGGATALPNLLLLCRRHHRMVHDGFRLEMPEGRPVFRRPDGSVLEDRAPP
jgi:HNH endonuclease